MPPDEVGDVARGREVGPRPLRRRPAATATRWPSASKEADLTLFKRPARAMVSPGQWWTCMKSVVPLRLKEAKRERRGWQMSAPWMAREFLSIQRPTALRICTDSSGTEPSALGPMLRR